MSGYSIKALVVGCGLTGSAIARFLKDSIKDIDVTIWEKASGAGGRMSTSRCPGRPACTADVGAQYISATAFYMEKHYSYYQELLKDGVITPMTAIIEGDRGHTDGTQHFVAPNGINTVVKHFLRKAGTVETRYGQRLTSLRLHDKRWEAETESGVKAVFDAVVLTMPTPQILQIRGSIESLLDDNPDVRHALSNAVYSSRYALAAFLPARTVVPVGWDAKYFPSDPCIRYVSIDSRKRGRADAEPSVVIHTSVPFGLAHLEDNLETLQPTIEQHAREVLPWLPPTSDMLFKCLRWRYSQVHEAKGCSSSGGYLSLGSASDPPLVCAGDAFMHSNFDGCLESALATSRHLTAVFAARQQ